MKVFVVWMGLVVASFANAHPLGNNTVNREAGLQLSRAAITLDYRVDIAEIPTLLAITDADTDGDGSTSKAEWASYARGYSERIQQGITLRVDDAPLALRLDSARATLAPGAAGLNILRIVTRFTAPLQPQTGMKLHYQDQREPTQLGWKEVCFRTASGLAVRASDVPKASSSRNLTAYPEGVEVPDVLSATVELGAISPASQLAPDKSESGSQALVSAVTPTVQSAAHNATPIVTPATIAAIPAPTPPAVQVVPVATQTVIPPPRSLPAWAFFRLGVHHIAIGWDHLMFLLGLILAQFMVGPLKTAVNPAPVAAAPKPSIRTPVRRLIGVVTAFTIAHSLTLGLAASGLVMLPGDWVEAAIALTIAYVGLMNLLGRTRHSTPLAFAFGLVHGFGFAGALAASMGSLRTQSNDWLLNLAAFNIGIEAFQLLLVIVLVPILAWIARRPWSVSVFNTLSFLVMIAGLGWFFSRI